METIEIKPEYSTQPFGQKLNPMVIKAIEYLVEQKGCCGDSKVADQGCGALRHIRLLIEYYNEVYLVDTEHQIKKFRCFLLGSTLI